VRVALVGIVLLAVGVAGCDTGKTAGDVSSLSLTSTPAPRTAELAADRLNGTAPAAVNFTLGASPGAASWRLAFGDGEAANGTGQPPAAHHTYLSAGNFSAELTVSYPDGANVSAATAIAVTTPAGPPMPDVVHVEFGPSFGCVGNLGADVCLSFQGGPDSTGIDGHWLSLQAAHAGLHLTSLTRQSPLGPVGVPVFGSVGADSDCVFTDAALAILGDADNASGSCDGIVPEGAAFLFIYPYAAPATEIVVDFVTP
jgi:PKD repeat protein